MPDVAGPNDGRKRRQPGLAKRFWRKVREPLRNSPMVKNAIASVVAGIVRFIDRSNRLVEGSSDVDEAVSRLTPAIGALWHGQHLLGPAVHPRQHRMVAMFSRSADAELNALVAEKLGFETVRGSGGRPGAQNNKGGARALIALKKVLDSGANVAMIADIPHGTPREAGLGVVTLAKVSGRPVVPIAVATSRRKVIEKSWDKTTINLPFGRKAVVIGDPIHVPADASPQVLEELRVAVTEGLNAATRRAYGLVDGAR